MSFWNNDDAATKRREEEQQRKADEARRRAKIVKAQRKATVARYKEQQRIRAERDAEDKKLRDELVEKMLNGGKDKKSPSTFPTLNRGFGGDRAQPTNVQQCFQHLKQPATPPQPGHAQPSSPEKHEEDDRGKRRGGGLPPLRRPF